MRGFSIKDEGGGMKDEGKLEEKILQASERGRMVRG